jgi:hypothetical protein
MSRATSDLLDMLHGLVAGALKDELVRAAALAVDEDAEKRQPINPQLIDKALKFLKDNAITAPLGNRPVNDLAAELADLNLEDEAQALHTGRTH